MIVTVILICVLVVYFLVKWLWSVVKPNKREPPLHTGALPIIGHSHLLFGDTIALWTTIKHIARCSLANGGVVRFTTGTWTLYMMTDPEDSFLVGTTCLHKDGVYDIAKPWLGEGLVTAPVDVWKRHRKVVNPGFSQHVLDGYLTVFNSQSRKLVDSLSDKAGTGYFDHVPLLEKTALEIICLTAMGIDDTDDISKNMLYMEAVSGTFHSFVQRVQSIWMLSEVLFRWSALKRRQDEMIKVLHGLSNEVIKRRKTALLQKIKDGDFENTPKRFKSFLDLLLESSMDGSLTDTEIRQEVDTMISAGYDTSATLMTYVFVVLGSYPEVQEKVFEEIESVLDRTDRDVEKDDLPKLVYLEAVLKEVLRLYPVVPLVARYLDKNVELQNYTLSAGASCFILMYGVNRHRVWGADADQFRPERWLSPVDLPDSANAFAGFGLGRRTCIGQKFALMSLKTTMCHVLRRYRITGDHTKMVLKMDIMLKADSGHHVKIERR